MPKSGVAASGAAAVEALGRAFDHARAIAGAELAGVMDRALEMSLDYLKTRVQFGKPIGAFQALQHRAVDLYIQKELAARGARGSARRARPRPRRRDARGNSRAGRRRAARTRRARITREAIQLHGAIGFTDEYDAGLYLKRALTLAAWLGDASWHRRRYARLAAGAAA